MATVLNDKKEDENVLSPPQTAGGSVAPAPAAAPTPSASPTSSAAANRGGSGRFVNIQKYIEANKPKSGQQGLGEQIGQKLGTQAQDIRAGIESAKSKFGQELAPEQQRLAQAGQTIGGALQTAQQNPSQLSQNQLDQFKQLREGYVGGPTEFNSSGLQQQQAALNQKAQNTQTEQGRFGLLRDYFGQPTYSRGQQRLDQLLLQSSPGSLRNLQQTAQQQSGGVEQALGGAQTEAQSSLQQLAQQRMEAQKQATEQVGSAQTGLQSTIENEAKRQTADRQNTYKSLQDILAGNKPATPLTASQINSYGLDPNMQIANLDLKNWLTGTEGIHTDVSGQNVMTPEQQSQLQALTQLSGGDLSSIPQRSEALAFNPFKEGLQGAAATAREQALRNRSLGISGITSALAVGADSANISAADIPGLIAHLNASAAKQERTRMGGGFQVRDQPYRQAAAQLKNILDKFNKEQAGKTLGNSLGVAAGPSTGLLNPQVLPPGVRS